MMLFVAITFPLFCAICGGDGTNVVELVSEERDVVDEEVNAVDPDSCEDRELPWVMV